MLAKVKARLRAFFVCDRLLPITEGSPLSDVVRVVPHFFDFLGHRYRLSLCEEDRALSLRELVERFSLPPAQVLFVEAQMAERTRNVKRFKPRQAKAWLEAHSARVLDAREESELRYPGLPGATPLHPALLEEMLRNWPRQRPILLYCHFGVRSLDVAVRLTDQGFTEVAILEGGIDAWSMEIDPAVPRYEGSWC